MRLFRLSVRFLFVLSCWTCTTENPVVLPEVKCKLENTSPVSEASKALFEGVYGLELGVARFGSEVVVKWGGKHLSIFTQTSYIVLEVGQKDSVIYLCGHWRVPTSDATGLINLIIAKDEGASSILKGVTPSSITIKGFYGNQNNPVSTPVVFQYKRYFSTKVTSGNFHILGHRGGGRTSDRLPVSENSIPMIGYAERLGATGVEIDIRLTKDKVPVLYHDADLNIRLTTKGPLNGPIENFTWNQLRVFVRLIRGEQIPRLIDALEYVVDSTQLNFVWLDIKNPEVVALIEPIQQEALLHADAVGRNVKILMGIPADDVLAAFKLLPAYQSIPSLCEISPEEARELNSRVWSPRWTLGTQNDLVAEVQSEGREVICWTIDTPGFIKQFIELGRFDGLLTNYPSSVAYYHYIQE